MSAKEKPSAAPAASPGSQSSGLKHSAQGAASESPQAKATRGRNKNDRAPGEPLPNQRHENFAQAYAVTNNGSEAYRRATGKTANANINAQDFLANPNVQERIREIRGETAVYAKKTRENVVDWLGEVIDEKRTVSKEQLKAAEILNKMCGWNEPEKVEQKLTVEVVKL